MVPKSKLLGKPSLIFVTVGSTNFKFDRLFFFIEKTLLSLKSNTKLIVQTGPSDYKWTYKNIKIKKYLLPYEISLFYSKADRIIIHGGFGSLFLLSKNAKVMPLILPRLRKYREHVNNHQKNFLTFLKNKSPKKLKKYFVDSEFIEKPILKYIKHIPQKNYIDVLIFSENNKKQLLEQLEQYINFIKN